MRCFAVMSDNRVLPATGIVQGRFVDGIHFSVGFTRYKYYPGRGIYEYEYDEARFCCKQINFFKQVDTDWFATEDVKMLLMLENTEDTDLNYFQSTDFNAGVIYGRTEKLAVRMIKDPSFFPLNKASSELELPIIQMIPKGCTAITEHEVIEATLNTVAEHFEAVYGKSFTLKFASWKKDKQYYKFEYTVTKKDVYKEMTVAEIEEALGYRIKVVADKE